MLLRSTFLLSSFSLLLDGCSQTTIIPDANPYGFHQMISSDFNPPQYVVCGSETAPCPSISSLQSKESPAKSSNKHNAHSKKKNKVCGCAKKDHSTNPSSTSK